MELQVIKQKIYEIRGQRVMLDFDLAALYEVEARALNQKAKPVVNNLLFCLLISYLCTPCAS